MGRRSRASITFLCRSSQELPIYLRCGDKLKVIERPWLLSRSVSQTRLQQNIAKTLLMHYFLHGSIAHVSILFLNMSILG